MSEEQTNDKPESGGGEDTKDKPQTICEPIPIPPDRHAWLISEGCLAVALLSLATTVITLTMLKK